MAKKAFMKLPSFTTPRAPAIWPRLNEPDTKYDAAGVYECKQALDLSDATVQRIKAKAMEMVQAKYDEVREQNPDLLTEEEHAAKVAELTKAGKAALIKKLAAPISIVEPMAEELDEETADGTGVVILKAKMKASGTYKSGPKTGQKWTRTPDIFNAQGKPLKNPPQIGGGSEVKMSIELMPYYTASTGEVGISFRLNAVQLITLVSFGQRDASAHGFGAEDGDDIDDAAEDEMGGSFGDESGTEDDDL